MRIGAQMTAAGHRPPEAAAKAFTFTTAMLLLRSCVVFLLFWVGH